MRYLKALPYFSVAIILGFCSTLFSQAFWLARIPSEFYFSPQLLSLAVATALSALYVLLCWHDRSLYRRLLVLGILFTTVFGGASFQQQAYSEKIKNSDEYRVTLRQQSNELKNDSLHIAKGWGVNPNKRELAASAKLDQIRDTGAGSELAFVSFISSETDLSPTWMNICLAILACLIIDTGCGWTVSMASQIVRHKSTSKSAFAVDEIVNWLKRKVSTKNGHQVSTKNGQRLSTKNGHRGATLHATNKGSGDSVNQKWTPDVNQIELTKRNQILALWKDGNHSKAEIARRVDCSRQHVQNVIKDLDINIDTTKKTNKAQRIQLLAQYLESYPEASLAEMAEAVGVSSRETVRKYLQEMGKE